MLKSLFLMQSRFFDEKKFQIFDSEIHSMAEDLPDITIPERISPQNTTVTFAVDVEWPKIPPC